MVPLDFGTPTPGFCQRILHLGQRLFVACHLSGRAIYRQRSINGDWKNPCHESGCIEDEADRRQ
jgi:hypothetical protein